MENQFGFTKERLQNLEIKASTYSVLDKSTPSLRLYVYPSGGKTFVLYRRVNNKPQRIKIGRFRDLSIEQARKEALRLNSLITLGQDPLNQNKEYKAAITFRGLFYYYYEQHASISTKRPLENKRTIERTVFPAMGNMKACDITPEFMRMFHAKLAELSSKGNANRVIAIISPVFNYCINASYYKGENPCAKVKKFKCASRDRFLSREELLKFFDAVKKEEALFEHFFLMLLYTGARKSNVLSMKWEDINFELGQWRVCADETKNKDVNIIHLSDHVIRILNMRLNMQKTSGISNFVFPGNGAAGHLVDPKRAFNRIRETMKIDNFRMHDLRRTLASYMAISGTSLNIIGKALNHKSQVSTSIYARLSEEPVKQAINLAILNINDVGHSSLFKANKEALEPNLGFVNFASLLA